MCCSKRLRSIGVAADFEVALLKRIIQCVLFVRSTNCILRRVDDSVVPLFSHLLNVAAALVVSVPSMVAYNFNRSLGAPC